MQQEPVGVLDIGELEESRGAKRSIGVISLEAVVDTCHGEKYGSQGRNVVDAAAAANHRLIVRKWPICKAHARSPICVSVAQLLWPPRLFGSQEGSAGRRAGIGIDIVWCVAGVDGLCP